MDERAGRPLRQVGIADHLWEAFARLAEALGSDRDALVNEAMHLFARQHGYAAPPLADAGREAVAARVLQAANALEEEIGERTPTDAEPVTSPVAASLYLVADNGDLGQVRKDRFVIGRGKHCDLVIDSPKVSREHAVIVRDGSGFWIEDLGSSNGTWHEKQRIGRRRIADGDEYFICSEKLRCVLR